MMSPVRPGGGTVRPATEVASASAGEAGPGRFGPSDEAGPGRFGPSAFDPGRRGVRALAVVAAVVVVAAGGLAWRARPRVEVVPSPTVQVTPAVPAGVDVTGAAEIVVAVSGRVRRPGLIRLSPGARVADALDAAGGALPQTDISLLNLARRVDDGELILVGVTAPPGAEAGLAGGQPGHPGAGGGKVNLNTATQAHLETLPGVGPVLAQRIIDHRERAGRFGSVADLRKVSGIGDTRFQQLRDLVTV